MSDKQEYIIRAEEGHFCHDNCIVSKEAIQTPLLRGLHIHKMWHKEMSWAMAESLPLGLMTNLSAGNTPHEI